ncbi:MAG TPA: type II toxin-antitoxin system VapC family toxin, partial [Acidobacteriota bacterium]
QRLHAVKLLLDTQVFLWMVSNASELSPKARRLAVAGENFLYLSLASVWEMAIKISLGKLKLAEPIESFITEALLENNIRQLEINFRHVARVADLPFHHRDPFDRLLVSQAQVEDLHILSADKAFDRYEVRRLW